MTSHYYIHATCIELDGLGILITGAPQSGKSTLALAMIERGARLVADDQTIIWVKEEQLWARSPDVARGVIEVSGFGMIRMEDIISEIPVACAIRITPELTERLPVPEEWNLHGHPIPCWNVPVDNPHSGMKAIAFLRAWASGRLVERLPVASEAKSA
jgi:HPr kinase/phosphorylase